MIALAGCAKPPKLDVSLSLDKQNANLIFVKVKVVNTEDRATVPIAIEVTGQTETNGHWDKASTILHPAAFVLNKQGTARDHQNVESSGRRRPDHADRQRTGKRLFVKNGTGGKGVYRGRAGYSKAVSVAPGQRPAIPPLPDA